MKQKPANYLRRARQGARRHSFVTGALNQYPSDQNAAHQHARHSKHQRYLAAFGAFFFSGVQKHNDENKQHHDGAGINDYLHCSDKLSSQQQVLHCQRPHHHHQRKRAVNGMPLHQQVHRPRHANRPERQK